MTISHLSHFGLEILGQSSTSITFAGTLANCKRMAFAHGMEVESTEGRIMSSDCGHAIYAPVDSKKPMRIWLKGGGMIQRAQDDYTFVMPLEIWENA